MRTRLSLDELRRIHACGTKRERRKAGATLRQASNILALRNHIWPQIAAEHLNQPDPVHAPND